MRLGDLRAANFSGAHLVMAQLGGVDLSFCNLRDADLRDVDFSLAKLIGADLRDSILCGANLRAAEVDGADFSRAVLGWNVFGEVDLSVAKGLETAHHIGPSSIAMNTLLRSKGNIPPAFLRGCGLSEWEVQAVQLYESQITNERIIDVAYQLVHTRSLQPIQYYSCFVSYSHTDNVFAKQLHDTLQAHGIRCWLDLKQLLPGDDIYEQVDRGIRLWDKIVLCCSEH
jgi:hypothetical protein